MKETLGLKPLLVSCLYPPQQQTERGARNMGNLIQQEFDAVLVSPSPKTWAFLGRTCSLSLVTARVRRHPRSGRHASPATTTRVPAGSRIGTPYRVTTRTGVRGRTYQTSWSRRIRSPRTSLKHRYHYYQDLYFKDPDNLSM